MARWPDGIRLLWSGNAAAGANGNRRYSGRCSARSGATSDGTVAGWGADYWGQATPPPGLDGVVAIAAGFDHSLALRTDGTVVSWGDDGSGLATPPAGLSGVRAVAAGWHHSLALKTDGTVAGWGWNDFGQATPRPD